MSLGAAGFSLPGSGDVVSAVFGSTLSTLAGTIGLSDGVDETLGALAESVSFGIFGLVGSSTGFFVSSVFFWVCSVSDR